jgi:hypothetical protein
MTDLQTRSGIYNVEYFSGSQASVYIGDIWVDEITSIAWQCQQNRKPLYGYASTLYDALAKGRVLVTGYFTINFKEAGYLWLILHNYRKLNPSSSNGPVFVDQLERKNIETSQEHPQLWEDMRKSDLSASDKYERLTDLTSYAALTGFSNRIRAGGGMDPAEKAFEAFEDEIWGTSQTELDAQDRRCDDPRFDFFDIFISYGDYVGNNSLNHTVRKLAQVSILGTSQIVNSDGQPIQEKYDFICRNLV